MSLDCRILRKKGDDQIYYYCKTVVLRPWKQAFGLILQKFQKKLSITSRAAVS